MFASVFWGYLFASVVLPPKNWCKHRPLVRLLMSRKTRLNLKTCNLWTGQYVTYMSVLFWLNLTHQNGKTFFTSNVKNFHICRWISFAISTFVTVEKKPSVNFSFNVCLPTVFKVAALCTLMIWIFSWKFKQISLLAKLAKLWF